MKKVFHYITRSAFLESEIISVVKKILKISVAFKSPIFYTGT